MKLYIPRVGEKIQLTENWSCSIQSEHRNQKIFDALGIKIGNNVHGTVINVTLPKNTILRIDRLYVRAPASDYDSITFTIEESPLPGIEKSRFWVKLREANEIECEKYFQDKEKIKKFGELFSAYANELNISEPEQQVEENKNIILDAITKTTKNYVLEMKVPTIALVENFISKYKQNKSFSFYHSHNNSSLVEKETNEAFEKVKGFVMQHKIPELLDFKIDVCYVLGNVIYKNQDTTYAKLLDSYFDEIAEKEVNNYRFKRKHFFSNDLWNSADIKKNEVDEFRQLNVNHLVLRKEAPQEALANWGTTLSKEDGEKADIDTLNSLIKVMTLWNKEKKKVKKMKM